MCKAVIKEIIDKKLVEQTARVGGLLYKELERLSAKYPEYVANLRGKNQG
jgi:4-aminobutyrate aminotransferase/(S)-3-amino-2-methylpropionate transaminase